MASQSPALEQDPASYAQGWQEISRLMDSGASWSGRERNCAYVNLGQRRFVDVSAAAGLDFIEDGRALACGDVDGDGDVDLWLRSRTGPTLRLIENVRAPGSDFVGLRLVGVSCNRDAVGARVELRAGGRTYLREVRAGEGYLAQSSLELTFGLAGADELESLVVHWPGGEAERFEPPASGARYRLVQGTGACEPLPERAVEREAVSDLEPLSSSARVVLRTPLPLPTAFLGSLRRSVQGPTSGAGRALLLNLFATWCAPCKGELLEFARHSTELSYVGLDVLPICLDAVGDAELGTSYFEREVAPHMQAEGGFGVRIPSERERDTFKVLLEHLIPKSGDAPVPTSLLVDKHGMVQVLYLGTVDIDTLLADAGSFGLEPEKVPVRSSYPGRWFYGMPRDLGSLAAALRAAGIMDHASYYAALSNLTRRHR